MTNSKQKIAFSMTLGVGLIVSQDMDPYCTLWLQGTSWVPTHTLMQNTKPKPPEQNTRINWIDFEVKIDRLD